MFSEQITIELVDFLIDYDKILPIEAEPRKAIIGQIDLPLFGIFGTCYSQPKEFVRKLCSQKSSAFYDTNTTAHELGQYTVDIVLSALNVLPNIKAWQTPSNSVADIHWKWDVIIEHEGYFYPAKIKSSVDAIRECEELFVENLDSTIEEIDERKYTLIDKYENIIERCMDKYGLTSTDAKIAEFLGEKDEKIHKIEIIKENYKKAEPLYIWAYRDENTIKYLTSAFAKIFGIKENIYEMQLQAVTNYKKQYKTVKDILIEEEEKIIGQLKRVIFFLKEYSKIKQENLYSFLKNNTNKSVQLEDILSHRIAENSLEIAERGLKYSEIFLEKMTNISTADINSINKYRLELIKFKINSQIKREIQQELLRSSIKAASRNRRYTSSNICNENKIHEENPKKICKPEPLDIEILSSKIEKLKYFDNKSDSPMNNDFKESIEEIMLFFKKKPKKLKNYDYKPE